MDDMNVISSSVRESVIRAKDAVLSKFQTVTDPVKNVPTSTYVHTNRSEPANAVSYMIPNIVPNLSRNTKPPGTSEDLIVSDATELRKLFKRGIPQKERTLIIGDSILKGIQRPGLDDKVDVHICSGAIVTDITNTLNALDMQQYESVIIFVGGNDVSRGIHPDVSRIELMEVVSYLDEQKCKVYICTVSPRSDADVTNFNHKVRMICEETGIGLIDCYKSFIYGDGNSVRHYFSRDGVHLSSCGSRTLVTTVNSQVHIVKKKHRVEQRGTIT